MKNQNYSPKNKTAHYGHKEGGEYWMFFVPAGAIGVLVVILMIP